MTDDYYERPSHVDEASWCPVCEPDRRGGPSVGPHVVYCVLHQPERDGRDDDAVRQQSYLSGSGEADGRDCRAFQALITRKGENAKLTQPL